MAARKLRMACDAALLGPLIDGAVTLEDIDLDIVQWVCMIPPEAPDFQPPSWLDMTQAPKDRTLQELMLAGDLEGLMVPFPPDFPPEAEGKVRRLFPDFATVEQAFWAQHHI